MNRVRPEPGTAVPFGKMPAFFIYHFDIPIFLFSESVSAPRAGPREPPEPSGGFEHYGKMSTFSEHTGIQVFSVAAPCGTPDAAAGAVPASPKGPTGIGTPPGSPLPPGTETDDE